MILMWVSNPEFLRKERQNDFESGSGGDWDIFIKGRGSDVSTL